MVSEFEVLVWPAVATMWLWLALLDRCVQKLASALAHTRTQVFENFFRSNFCGYYHLKAE